MALGLVAAAFLVPASAARAATTPCAGESLQQVFAAWGDSSWYFLAPDGGFEGGAAGWTLTGGATVVDGNEPFALGGAADERSLSLPAGASATSPEFCVRPDSRTVRWIQRGPRGGLLLVRVIHTSPHATVPGRLVGGVRTKGGWEPSPRIDIPLGGTGLRDGMTTVALHVTAVSGDWTLDDLYVDPRCRN
jgi:hypothetical protein